MEMRKYWMPCILEHPHPFEWANCISASHYYSNKILKLSCANYIFLNMFNIHPFDFRFVHDCNGFLDLCCGMIICTCGFGFFHTAFGPIIAEYAILVTGPKRFNFAYGYVLVMMGLGWTVGTPAAGRLFSIFFRFVAAFAKQFPVS